MSRNETNLYDIDVHLAEIYDQIETDLGDVIFLRRLIGASRQLKILEPFCGSGRILIPLAQDGHEMVGMDQAQTMLDRACEKILLLPPAIQRKISLQNTDVVSADWPGGFDLVILGGNCFYELATSEEQEKCIQAAKSSLVPGGMIYIDNDHMEGDLEISWQEVSSIQLSLVGVCSDGTSVESTRETIWYDVHQRLVKFRRRIKIICPDGNEIEKEVIQQKHPVSAVEIRGWLEGCEFSIEQVYGDYDGNPYMSKSRRAILWARKVVRQGF